MKLQTPIEYYTNWSIDWFIYLFKIAIWEGYDKYQLMMHPKYVQWIREQRIPEFR